MWLYLGNVTKHWSTREGNSYFKTQNKTKPCSSFRILPDSDTDSKAFQTQYVREMMGETRRVRKTCTFFSSCQQTATGRKSKI